MNARKTLSLFIMLPLLLINTGQPGAAGVSPASSLDSTAQQQSSVSTSNLALLGQIGGEARGIVVDGDYAYMGEGPRLDVIDLTNSADPQLIGQSALLPGTIQDLDFQDGLVYAAAGEAGLRIFDPSDPYQPIEIGLLDIAGVSLGLDISGTVAYVLGGEELHAIDIIDPSQPVDLDSFVVAESAYGIEIYGSYAFIGGGLGGLQVMDVSDPSNLVEVGGISIPGFTGGIDIEGNYAYLTAGPFGLRIIDISKISAMHEVGFFAPGERFFAITVVGDKAYMVGSGESGLLLSIDVSNPASPVEIDRFFTPCNPRSLFVRNGKVFVTDLDAGLWLIDASDQGHMAQVGKYRTPGPAYGVAARGEVAYIAAGCNGLVSLNISNPSLLRPIGWYDHAPIGGDYAVDLALARDFAFLIERDGLAVVDISDPIRMTETSFYSTNDRSVSIFVNNQVAFIGNWGSLEMVSVTDPRAPDFLGRMLVPNVIEESVIVSDMAYLAAIGAGLRIVDVSNPASPSSLGSFSQPAFGVHVANQLAYVVGAGFKAINVSNPSHPQEVGSFTRPDDEFDFDLDIAVSDQLAYISIQEGGLYLLDIGDPTQPKLVGRTKTPGSSTSIHVDGDRIYLASGAAGLYVFQSLDQNIYFPLIVN